MKEMIWVYKNIISGIYSIKNIINNKMYIGQSINIYDRFCRHKNALKKKSHDNEFLQADWNIYGKNCFEFSIIEYCSVENLDNKEIYYINLYNTTNFNCGYNMTYGGKANVVDTDYTCSKISKAIKQYYDSNPDARRIQKEHAFKQWSDPEIKAKIMGENNGMYGRHHTDEAREKIRQARLGKSSSRRIREPVYCVELDSIFEDACEASKKLALHSGGILGVCRGERKTCGGYHWKFITENN